MTGAGSASAITRRLSQKILIRCFPTHSILNRSHKGDFLFWHIAKAANVSIVCWYLDNTNKVTRWLGELKPGDSLKEDLLTIHGWSANAGYSFPQDLEALDKTASDPFVKMA